MFSSVTKNNAVDKKCPVLYFKAYLEISPDKHRLVS